MSDDDAARVDDEVCALRAIFGDENVSFSRAQPSGPSALSIALPDALGTLSMILPVRYPSAARPAPPTLSTAGLSASRAAALVRAAFAESDVDVAAEKECEATGGEVCVFEIASAVQAALERQRDQNVEVAVAEEKGEEAQGAESAAEGDRDVFHGEPIVDRRSVFQAHVARIACTEDVDDVLRQLHRTSRKVATATHNVLAYVVDSGAGVVQDCDDDGESGAGKGLLFTLQQCEVRNCVVVVSRWFGGVKLGPVRFKHINNCARVALMQCKGQWAAAGAGSAP